MPTNKQFNIFFISLLLGLLGCLSDTPSFESFDSINWKNAIQQNTNYRTEVIEQMKKEFRVFHHLSEKQVVKILGKPNQTLLYTRGQKFFVYQLSPHKETEKEELRIRFSALGTVNEVLVLKSR